MALLNKLANYARAWIWKIRSRRRLQAAGARFDSSLTTYGVPIVEIAPNSSLQIGERVVLCSDSRFTPIGVARPVILRTLRKGASIQIGSDSGLSGATICSSTSVKIGERCLLGADCKILDTDFHPVHVTNRRRMPESSAASSPIVIGDDVFIGTGALVLKGVTIGAGSVIAAEAVVTRDVPAGNVVAGNPARSIGLVGSTKPIRNEPAIDPAKTAAEP